MVLEARQLYRDKISAGRLQDLVNRRLPVNDDPHGRHTVFNIRSHKGSQMKQCRSSRINHKYFLAYPLPSPFSEHYYHEFNVMSIN